MECHKETSKSTTKILKISKGELMTALEEVDVNRLNNGGPGRKEVRSHVG
jgi:hypothetical protein